jgi:hypothetical protein
MKTLRLNRRVLSVVSFLLAGVFLCGSASGAWVALTGDPVAMSALPENMLIVGDKEFADFYLFGIGAGGAIAPNKNDVYVQGGQDDVSGDYGLKFYLTWNAFSGQTLNANLEFTVSIIDDPKYADYLIKDVSMILHDASAVGTGGVNASENVWDHSIESNPPPPLASLSCSKQANDSGLYLTDHAEFAGVRKIWVYKDISITGGTGVGGSAHLSGFYQYFSQEVPEPMTMTLLGFGGLLLLKRKKA